MRLIGVIAVLAFATACDQPKTEHILTGPTMGTEYRVNVISTPLSQAQRKTLEEAIEGALGNVNQRMSTYISSSELSQFNRLPKGSTVELSDDLFEVVNEALKISMLSDGAFDATLGKVIRLWGFAEDGQINQQPTAEVLSQARQSVGHKNLRLEGQSLTKLVTGLELNLSAIAKGYAVDKVGQALDVLGYTNYLINVGGELKASGKNAEGQFWRVGIEKPHVLGGIVDVVELHNQAVATSGDYRNFVVIDGQQFSHTIDPETLRPVLHKLASVSVLSDKASTADALATALLALGEKRGVAFAKRRGIAAYFIIRGDAAENYYVEFTGRFRANLRE